MKGNEGKFLIAEIYPMINNKHLQCIKSLYKSTYKRNAFTKGKSYKIEYKDNIDNDSFIFIIDNCENLFSFKEHLAKDGFYLFSDYFKMKESND
tara:strand:+ start:101 stop:382 length:282 start_codon:yes stop_codon:yes gene_type:complete